MKIDLMRDPSKKFPHLDAPEKIREFRVWHCKYKSLQDVRSCVGLVELVIGSLNDDSLDFIFELKNLRYLRILHFPKVKELSPLAGLKSLEALSLSTSPSWDASGKKIVVEALDPLSEIFSLRHIELFGVVPPDGSLRALERLPALETGRFSGYSPEEVERFYSVKRIKDDFNPKSSFV